MYKYLLALILGVSVSTSIAEIIPIPKLKEPPRPIVTYVANQDLVLIQTPGEPNAIRILCHNLKGKGEVAMTVGGTTIIFPVNCPERPVPPFE